MGLGKTLATLAVIVGSLKSALDFASENTRADSEKWRNNVPSKSTLVIVPSSRKVFMGTLKRLSYMHSIA